MNRKEMMRELNQLINIYSQKADYYIVGAPQIVKINKKLLNEENIPKKNIWNDTFFGY